MTSFTITKEEKSKVNEWLKNIVYPAWISYQKANYNNPTFTMKDCWRQGFPYMGAIGGGLTYSFSPNAIGMVVEVTYPGLPVKNDWWQKRFGAIRIAQPFKLDLTDYDNW